MGTMPPLSTPVSDNISNFIDAYMAGPFLIVSKQESATSFLGIILLVCKSLVPEPTGGVCRILCGPNVQTLVSCYLGVGCDTPLVTIRNILCTTLAMAG